MLPLNTHIFYSLLKLSTRRDSPKIAMSNISGAEKCANADFFDRTKLKCSAFFGTSMVTLHSE